VFCLRAVDARFRGKFSRKNYCLNKENETASLGIYGLISYGEPFKERRVHDWAFIEQFLKFAIVETIAHSWGYFKER
jgi:hypothetical protein